MHILDTGADKSFSIIKITHSDDCAALALSECFQAESIYLSIYVYFSWLDLSGLCSLFVLGPMRACNLRVEVKHLPVVMISDEEHYCLLFGLGTSTG